MYTFILFQYQMGNLTADDVRSYVPMWLTADEAEAIIASQQ